ELRKDSRRLGRKRHERRELSQLIEEGSAKMLAMGRIESAVTNAMIGARECNNPCFSCGQPGGLESSLDRFETGIQENGLAASCSTNVILLDSYSRRSSRTWLDLI